MNAWWSYFWPVFGLGLAIGIVAGAVGFRRAARRNAVLAIGAALAIAAAALWHGPFGASDRLTQRIETQAHEALVYYEMTQVSAHLHHDPLTRRLILSGPADDFQSSELVRLLSTLPGVTRATWSAEDAGMPLIAEGALAALLGFLIGLLLAYLVELRRRYNAQWKW